MVDFNSINYVFNLIFESEENKINTYKIKKIQDTINLKSDTLMTLLLHY